MRYLYGTACDICTGQACLSPTMGGINFRLDDTRNWLISPDFRLAAFDLLLMGIIFRSGGLDFWLIAFDLRLNGFDSLLIAFIYRLFGIDCRQTGLSGLQCAFD